MLICPIRHHSPAAALQVQRLIRARRPQAVLVEGPADASDLIPLLLDPETEPPVALYAYQSTDPAGETPRAPRKDGAGSDTALAAAAAAVRKVYYPFCHYSPEYVALREGQDVGARLLFCDVPAAVTLASDAKDDQAEDGAPHEVADLPPPSLPGFGDFAQAVTAASGFDSFEEFWEAAFEQDAGARDVDAFVTLLGTFGAQARSFTTPRRDAEDALRERHMAAVARSVVAEGVPEEQVLVVCGAAHAAPIARAFAEESEAPPLPAGAPVQIALIPFSFPRLSEQLGYGAGNRAPWYYQRVWRAGGDYAAATRYALLALAGALRGQGQSASLAQCIDAQSLATVLAGMRGKRAPGAAEFKEAAIACFAQGQQAAIATALHRVLIGDTLGRITPRVGHTPLQREFYATAQHLGLPVLDAPKQVLLHMVTPHEAAQSTFLHRLAVAEVPFAREMESGLGGRAAYRPPATDRQGSPEPLRQLARVREKWELQWTPATDAQLIERTAWGSTLADVCRRLLDGQLATAQRIDAGTGVLLRLALCDLADAMPPALARCEALAADSASFPALARATYHLDGLLTFGAARRLPAERLGALAARMFARAALHLPAAVICGDDAAAEVQETLGALHDLVQRGSPAVDDPSAFWQSVQTVAEMPATHPALRGLALVLLELDGRLARDELAARLRYWLSQVSEANENAHLVAGLFSLHRGTLVRNRALIGAVTDFLLDLEIEQLTPLLPVLRRSLGNLSGAERTYLSETLAAVLGVESGTARWTLRLSSAETAVLREADQAVAALLAQWEERYGIG